MIGIFKNIYLIGQGTTFSKMEMLFAYLKIQFKDSVLVRLLRIPVRTERLLGFRVSFFDYSSFTFLFREIFIKGEYQFKSENPNPVILDCGSNIGMSVLFFHKLFPSSRITAFEPDPQTFGILESNLRQNSLRNVEALNFAVSGKEGEIDFFQDAEISGSPMMSMQKGRTPNAVVVKAKAVRLSSFITKEIDFAKIDVEGAETDIIRELAESGKLRSIRQMCIEYHHHMNATEDSFSKILDILESNGFGYQIEARIRKPFSTEFQDVLLKVYRKA